MKISNDTLREIQVVAERAKVIFDKMGWTWYDEDYPPTVETLVEGISELYVEAYKNAEKSFDHSGQCSSGRILCVVNQNPEDFLYNTQYYVELLGILFEKDIVKEEKTNQEVGIQSNA
jgi:hypothetical protein